MTGSKRVEKQLKSIVRRSPLPFSDEEFDIELEVPANPFGKSPILIGKIIDFVDLRS